MSESVINLINNIDTELLGEDLMSIAENLLYKDANIAICKISVENLKMKILITLKISLL